MTVAFLGLGRMGSAMSRHVVDAGHDLVVWNRTPGRAGPLLSAGATEAGSVAEAVRSADRVVLMLFGPDSVDEVLTEVTGAAPAGALVIDATTVSPEDSRRFAARCEHAGLRYLDAPVAGSIAPATDGTLGVLVGAGEQDFQDALPLLELWADPAKIRRLGPVGAGSAMKLCNNLALAYTIAGVGETLRLGADLGIARDALLDVLAKTPLGGIISYKRPMLTSGDYSAPTFSLELLAKDLDLALGAGSRDLEVARAVRATVQAAVDAGHGGEDFAALAGYLA